MVSEKKKKIIKYAMFTVLILSLLGVFIWLSICVLNNKSFKIDSLFLEFAKRNQSGGLVLFFKIITNLVNPILLGIISFILLFLVKKQRGNCMSLFLNLAIMFSLSLVLKLLFVRPRPESAIIDEIGYSFPSGHTFCAIAFYGFLTFMIFQSSLKNPYKIILPIIFNFLVLMVAFSRIYLQVHYFTDVIAGLIIGFIYLFIFCFICHKIKFEKANEVTEYKKHTFLQGFKFASAGLFRAFKEENNLIVQFCATMIVVVFGIALKISAVEWCICLVLCCAVMCLEMVNTALENICDMITLEENEKIRNIKDISAGAVWLMAICSAIIALIIFVPKLGLLF